MTRDYVTGWNAGIEAAAEYVRQQAMEHDKAEIDLIACKRLTDAMRESVWSLECRILVNGIRHLARRATT